MDLKGRLAEDLKEALRSRDKLRVSVIRLLTALIKNREVEKRGPLTEAELLQALTSSCKARREAIDQYRRGGREDLATKEEAELKILEGYLPPALPPEELHAEVARAVAETQAASPRDMGKVMAVLMPRLSGRADGKVVSEMVRRALAGGAAGSP